MLRMILTAVSLLCSLAFFVDSATAQPAPQPRPEIRADTPSGFPVPRYVTLKAAKTRARTGPSFDHPVAWIYQRRGLPVEVVAETTLWRRVRDPEGDEAWVHESTLDGTRRVLIRSAADPAQMREQPDETAAIVAFLEAGAIARARACQGDWCRISAENWDGWILRATLWGVYADEEFE